MTEYNTDEFFAEERYEQSICMTCANEMNCDGKNEVGVVVWCTKYAGKYSKPKSNGDRIRAMSDEELADVLDHVQGDAFLVGIGERENSAYPGAGVSWLDWLKQEVDTCSS